MSAREMQSGTLRLFVLVEAFATSPRDPEMHVLAAIGGPNGFSLGGDTRLDDVDFGDSECKELPDWRQLASGLWVLEWAWVQVEDEDGEQFFDCRYPDAGTWRRLTDVELQALANGTIEQLAPAVQP